MAEYTPPPKSNISFSFSTGGYTPPDFGDLSLNFDVQQIQSAMSNLSASVRVFDTKREAYTYLKYCDRYIIGYSDAGVQIISERCYYGGIRDIGGFIRSTRPSYADLSAEVTGKVLAVDLPAYIGVHPYYVLPAYIRGFMVVGFPASIVGWGGADLSGIISPIPSVNLSAKIEQYFPPDLPADVHGWQTSDLGAYIGRRYKADLRGVIGVIEDLISLPALIKGWMREVYRDLPAFVQSFKEEFLPAQIRGTEYRDLGASLIYIQPEPLAARIRGWQTLDLQGIIDGAEYPWNLPATINSTGALVNLPAYIKCMADTRTFKNLPAYIKTLRFTQDFPAQLHAYHIKDLNAFLNSGKGREDLPSEIYPKMIRLTAVLAISTMEHSDLVGVINASCLQSDYRDLGAGLNPVYMRDLGAYIKPLYEGTSVNLAAQIGHDIEYLTIDKLPIDVYITQGGFRTEDKISIYLNTTRSAAALQASIIGDPYNVQLAASIIPQRIRNYDFEVWKKKERVYDLRYGEEVDYKDVDVDFESIVSEYLYSSIGNVATRAHIDEHWRTRLMSFYSFEDAERYLTKLYKVRILFDLHRFNSIDEAIRYGIEYVTTGFKTNLSATINCVGEIYSLPARIFPKFTTSTRNNLTSYINGTFQQEDDEVILNTGTDIQTIDI